MINFHSRMLKPWLSMSILAMVAALCFTLVATTGASAHTASAHNTAYGLQQFTPHHSLYGGPGGHSSSSHSSSSHATSSHDESSGNNSSSGNSSSRSYTHFSHPYYRNSTTSNFPWWLTILIVVVFIIIVISIARRRRSTP